MDAPQPDEPQDAQAVDPWPSYWLTLDGAGLHLEREISQAQVLNVLEVVLRKLPC